MSFLWVLLGPPALLPEDIDRRTVFIDIMANDQTSRDIKKELTAAERQYERARYHVVLATETVLERAWCLYEIAVRREAGGRSQLVVVGGEEGAGVRQLDVTRMGALAVLGMVCFRVMIAPVLLVLGSAVLRLVWGIRVGEGLSARAASFGAGKLLSLSLLWRRARSLSFGAGKPPAECIFHILRACASCPRNGSHPSAFSSPSALATCGKPPPASHPP
jgi:hypothetical protein